MSILPVTIPPKKLAQTITSTATSFKMNNILAWDGGDLVPADFGTEGYGVFINSTRTQIEIFKFDPATIADASITILERGLGYSGGDVEDSSRKFPWASNDTTVQLGTDAPQLFRDFLSASNPSTITGLYEFDVLPQSTVVPTVDDELVNKAYVDGLTSPAITIPVNQTAHGLAVGDVIKVLGVNTFEKAQADTGANAEVVGIVTIVTDVDNFTYATEGVITTGVPVEAAETIMFLDPVVAGGITATEPTTATQWNVPLAVINESGVRMTFHKYKKVELTGSPGILPYASETVAGIVEEATEAEVAAKAATGATGAKLFVPPSKLPLGGEITLPAYENIAKGDAVGISHYYPAQENNAYDNTGDADSDQALTVVSNPVSNTYSSSAGSQSYMTYNEKRAQKFYAPSGITAYGVTLKLKTITVYSKRDTFDANPIFEIRKDTYDGTLLQTVTAPGTSSSKYAVNIDVSAIDFVPGDVYFIVIRQTGQHNYFWTTSRAGLQWLENTTPNAIIADTAQWYTYNGSVWDSGDSSTMLETALTFDAMPTTAGNTIVQKIQLPVTVGGKILARAEDVRVQITQDTANIVEAFILDSATPAYGTLVGTGVKSATTGSAVTITACSAAEAEALPTQTDLWLHIHQVGAGVASARYDSTDANPLPVMVANLSTDGGDTFAEQVGRNYVMQLDLLLNQALGHLTIFKASAAAFDNRLAFAGFAKETVLAGEDCLITQGKSTGVHTGLTVGRRYYLQDTDGAIGLTMGTHNIDLGYAISATELFRDRQGSKILQSVSTTFYPQNDGLIFSNDSGGAILSMTIADRINLGAGEFLYTRSELADGEGSLGGFYVASGERVSFEGGWDRRGFQLTYPS